MTPMKSDLTDNVGGVVDGARLTGKAVGAVGGVGAPVPQNDIGPPG